MRTGRFRATTAALALGGLMLAALAACSDEEGGALPRKDADTRAVEEQVGDFVDYYDSVLRLARQYAAYPDSFRAGLDSLPGSHLSEEDWEAWPRPYRDDPAALHERLETVIANLGR